MKINAKRGAAAAAVTILFLTGCGPADSTPTAAAPASQDAAKTGDTMKKDCEAVVGGFRELIAGMLKNAVPGEGADEKDQADAMRQALTDYAAKTRAQAGQLSDPALRTAVEQHAAAAEKLAGKADPTDLEDPEFEKGTGEIETLCADALTPKPSPGAATVRIGAPDSACSLPVSFDLLPLWKPKAVDLAELGELGDLFRNGPFEAVCEVDGKPAGEVGFVRVHLAPGHTGTPRGHLEAYIEGSNVDAKKAGNFEVRSAKYAEVTLDGQPAAEVTYETYNKSMEHESKYSAFAVNTSKGAVIVSLSPFGADEHANVLPAFELAKKTLKVS